jgi:hypothetical protein
MLPFVFTLILESGTGDAVALRREGWVTRRDGFSCDTSLPEHLASFAGEMETTAAPFPAHRIADDTRVPDENPARVLNEALGFA